MLNVRDASEEDLVAIRTLLLQLPIEPETELGDDAKATAALTSMHAQAGHSLRLDSLGRHQHLDPAQRH